MHATSAATLSQRANNAIVATQTASTFFIMPAIFAGHVAQLKMPRLDAYLALADKQVLFDYFNLCAEEYLYYKTGFIDEEVWASWLRGMGAFAKVEHIRSLWQAELEAGSYYGFTLDLLPSAG